MEPIEDPTAVDRTTRASQAPARPRAFTSFHTGLYLIAWTWVMVQGWGARIGSDPTAWLYDPAATSARVANRDLDLATVTDAAAEGKGPRGAWLDLLSASVAETLDAVIAMQFDAGNVVADRIDAGEESLARLDAIHARLVISFAESGDLAEAHARIDDITNEDLRRALSEVLGDREPEPDGLQPSVDPIAVLVAAGIDGWLLDRAAIRMHQRAGDEATVSMVQQEILARGGILARRSEWLSLTHFALIAVGLLVAFAAIWRPKLVPEPAVLSIPWSASTGVAVMVRADFWNRFYFLSLGDLGVRLSNPAWLDPFYTYGTWIAATPMFWLVYRHLFDASWRNAVAALGLEPARWVDSRILAIAASCIAINLLGVSAIGWGSYAFGYGGAWAEGIDERLIFGTTLEVWQTCFDYLVATPVVEEILFRGLLFYTLRHRLGGTAAALASATFFSAVHFYSVPGFLMTLWSGFVWALAFERARSLVPGILAHSVYNALFVLGMLGLYR